MEPGQIDYSALKRAIAEKSRELGFDAVGFAAAELPEAAAKGLDAFLDKGCHGDMDWMAKHADRRRDPRVLWGEARSVIVLGMNYGGEGDPLENLEHKEIGNISVYARGKDYHDIVKKRLKTLGRWIGQTWGCDLKVFVDTAPVLEKPLGAQGGIGWQGKHTNLVSTKYGSWLFLGEIFTTLAIPADEAQSDHCGSCRACLDICPTNAFIGEGHLDARRCISYLTIEHKGVIAQEFREPMGNRIYGCDDCLAVCPWNKFAKKTGQSALDPRGELSAPDLATLAGLDDAAFRALFAGTPVKRLGRDRFIRNVLIAIGNSGQTALADHAVAQLDDSAPLVRGMAVWALSRLLGEEDFAAIREKRESQECDATVIAEWQAP